MGIELNEQKGSMTITQLVVWEKVLNVCVVVVGWLVGWLVVVVWVVGGAFFLSLFCQGVLG